MKLIAKSAFNVNGIFYNKGDEIKVDNKQQLIKLQERGFIEPLTQKEIQDFGKVKEQPTLKSIINKKEEK